MGPSRAEATRGVQERLAATVHAYPGLQVVPVPEYLLPGPPGGVRVRRGGRLPDLDGLTPEVYAAVAELWEHAGGEVRREGRRLIVDDPAGYRIELTQDETGSDPVLSVASPPIAAPLVDRGLLAGLAAGVGVGCLGPCVFSIGPMAAFPALAGLSASFWAWVPLFLLVSGGALALPETRRFGTGLLLSGALLGVTVAIVFSS
ncbi:MAG: hypothetical protein ABW046_19760 [Actinoplanes sp.]